MSTVDLRFCALCVIPLSLFGEVTAPLSAYVQSGLIAQWDGYYNVTNAAGAAIHDGASKTWTDMSGHGHDLTIQHGNFESESFWCDGNGHTGNNGCAVAADTISDYLTVEATYALVGANTKQCVMDSGVQNRFLWHIILNNTREVQLAQDKPTVQLDDNAATNTIAGTYASTSASTASGAYLFGIASSGSYNENWSTRPSKFTIGWGTNASRAFKGRVFALRLYDRVLSADELAWNSAIDRMRFRGATSNETGCAYADGKLSVRAGLMAPDVAAGEASLTLDGAPATVGVTNWVNFADKVSAVFKATTYDGGLFVGWTGDTDGLTAAQLASTELSLTLTAPRLLTPVFSGSERTTVFSARLYVTNGLVAHYDGYETCGYGRRDTSTPNWVNLVDDTKPMVMSGTWEWQSDAGVYFNKGGKTDGIGTYTVKATPSASGRTVEIAARMDGGASNGRYFGEQYLPCLYNRSNEGNCFGLWAFGGMDGTVCSKADYDHFGRFTTCGVAVNFGTRYTRTFFDGAYYLKKTSTCTATYTSDLESYVANRKGKDRSSRLATYALRIYDRELTDAEVLRNCALDRMRFNGATSNDTGFAASGDTLRCAYLVRAASTAGEVSLTHRTGSTETAAAVGVTNWWTCSSADTVTFVATPGEGADFSRWEGDLQGLTDAQIHEPSLALPADSPRRLTAVFAGAIRTTAISACNYVTNGLVAHFDGIENYAYGIRHEGLVAWTNLVDAAHPMAFAGDWTWSNGNCVYFNSAQVNGIGTYVVKATPAATGRTIELAAYIDSANQNGRFFGESSFPCLYLNNLNASSAKLAVWTMGEGAMDGPICDLSVVDPVKHFSTWGLAADFAARKVTACFDGGYYRGQTAVGDVTYKADLECYLANRKPALDRGASGSYYALRIYDRVLTDVEIARNHALDRMRFNGATSNDTGYAWTNDRLNLRTVASVSEAGATVSVNGSAAATSNELWSAEGATVTVVATPPAGRQFKWWIGDIVGLDAQQLTLATLSYAADRPRTLTAVFGDGTVTPTVRAWTGALQDGRWSSYANWEPMGVPGDGDDITIPAGTGAAVCDEPTANLHSLTVLGKLQLRNWTTCVTAETVIVKSGGAIAVERSFADGEMSNRVWIACNNLDVQAGGKINANQLGYVGRSGPGWEGVTIGSDYYGGSYGGQSQDGVGAKHSHTYGSVSEPTDPGTGGGKTARVAGGAIRVDARNAIKVNGTISANGSPTVIWNGGGASGGSVYISCRTIEGAGTVSASGGENVGTYGHSAGGGGRIAVHYDAAAQTAADCRVRFAAKGGIGKYETQYGTNRVTVASPGTLWFTDDQFLTGMSYTNGWRFAGEWHSGSGATALTIPHDVLMDQGALYFVPPVQAVDFQGALSVTGRYSAVNRFGGTNVSLHVGGDCYVNGARLQLDGGSLRVDGNLVLGEEVPSRYNAAELSLGGALSVGRWLSFGCDTVSYFIGADPPSVLANHIHQVAGSTLVAEKGEIRLVAEYTMQYDGTIAANGTSGSSVIIQARHLRPSTASLAAAGADGRIEIWSRECSTNGLTFAASSVRWHKLPTGLSIILR